ncbi:MAG: guanylate kinase [Eubacteriaceae bacterium]|jgi:guanylate kinase|nr:guanylate kinase [Eubacteriaceae bacterium]
MGNLFVVSGPSGSGKSTLCALAADMDKKIKISVSATTRAPRGEEKNGVEYFFLSNEQFDEKLAEGDFYEYANVFGNRYGTLKSHVDSLTARGFDVILEIDYQGAYQVRDKNKEAYLIFVMPPSYEELKKRLTDRHTESEEQLNIRLAKASSEMEERVNYDKVIINDSLPDALGELLSIIESKRN